MSDTQIDDGDVTVEPIERALCSTCDENGATHVVDLLAFQMQAEVYLDRIAALLVPEMKLTLIARHPTNDEADILMTVDDLDGVIALIQRRMQAAAPVTTLPPLAPKDRA